MDVRTRPLQPPLRLLPRVLPPQRKAPETPEAEFVSLEEADAEATGAKKPAEGAEAAAEDEEVEIDDEGMDDAAFIEEQEEEDADVTDIIGGDIENEEEG